MATKTTTHSPIEATIKSVYAGDASEATCAKCNQTIVEWNYRDDDGDRAWFVFEPWAVEVKVQVREGAWRTEKVTDCPNA
jgi:hypothetical protein